MGFSKPRPRPAQASAALAVLSAVERDALAKQACYVGSPHHTNIPKFGIKADPRVGAMKLAEAEADKLKNPDCLLCPPKWARRHKDVTELLRSALRAGTFVTEGAGVMPARLWVRDPEEDIVYEAKLSEPPRGYKGYPLTSFQVAYNLPFKLP